MTRGRAPGTGAAQARILAALKGGETLRSAELAARAKVNHHSLSKATRALLDLGLITTCMVQPLKGNKTLEYRLGPGRPPVAVKPLNTKAIAQSKHRSSSGPLPPIPVIKPAAAAPPPRATGGTPDAALLQRVQRMGEAEFGEFVSHLARVWAWARKGKAA